MSSPADRSPTLVRGRFDPAEPTEPMETVVDLLAHAEGVSPLSVTPLYESIDPDALNRLFGRGGRDRDVASLTVEFRADGRDVVVSGDGLVRILASD